MDILWNIWTMLKELTLLSVVVRIGLSIAIGGLLGAERGLRNRPAGFMTYVLVCMGSCIMMMTNLHLAMAFPGADPGRLGAQVVSGIGFLGAGTIIVTRKDEVRGLTTAAGLWVAAGLGLAMGSGFYAGALAGCLCYIFAIKRLGKVDTYIKRHARNMQVYLEYNADFSMRGLYQFAESQGFELFDIQRGTVNTLKTELGVLFISLDLGKKANHRQVLEDLYTIDGVEYIQEIG